MKTCPNCGELIGDSAVECFKCHYNYKAGRVITREEIAQKKEKEQQELQARINERKAIDDKINAELEEIRMQIAKNNPLYEYKVVVINDESNGSIDQYSIRKTLNDYAQERWRLHSIFTNEVGKTSQGTSVSFLSTSINATIDQTILVFERMVEPESSKN